MDESTYHSLRPKGRLDLVTNPLKNPGGVLSCLEKFLTTIKQKDKMYSLTLHVISGCETDNPLSRSAAYAIGLVFKVDDVDVQESVFENGGRMVSEPVKIVFATMLNRTVVLPLVGYHFLLCLKLSIVGVSLSRSPRQLMGLRLLSPSLRKMAVYASVWT